MIPTRRSEMMRICCYEGSYWKKRQIWRHPNLNIYVTGGHTPSSYKTWHSIVNKSKTTSPGETGTAFPTWVRPWDLVDILILNHFPCCLLCLPACYSFIYFLFCFCSLCICLFCLFVVLYFCCVFLVCLFCWCHICVGYCDICSSLLDQLWLPL